MAHPPPPSSSWELVRLVADGSKDDQYDTPTEDTYELVLPSEGGGTLGIDGLRAVSFTVTGGPTVQTTLHFHGLVDAGGGDDDPGGGAGRPARPVSLQTVTEGDPDLDVAAAHVKWSLAVATARSSCAEVA